MEAVMTRRNESLTAIGYVRVSGLSQELSAPGQRAEIETWAAANGYDLAATFEDLGTHGDAPIDDRCGLVAALDAVADRKAGALVVWRRDRLGRDSIEVAMAERLAERSGARVLSTVGTNGDSPEDRLMRRIIDAFAEYELALIRSRTRRAMATKRRRRELTSSKPPYGWRIPAGTPRPVDGRRSRPVTLEPDPMEQRTIERIRELRESGLSFRRISSEMNDSGAPARGARWHPMTVKRILDARI
jgi:DNA invertase Pin-like site-specific DNA recombinase